MNNTIKKISSLLSQSGYTRFENNKSEELVMMAIEGLIRQNDKLTKAVQYSHYTHLEVTVEGFENPMVALEKNERRS